MSRLTEWMDRKWYGTYRHRWDDWLLREWILKELTPESRILDIGAGRGGKEQMNFKGLCALAAGVDVDAAVLENEALDEAKLQHPPEYRVPYPDACFDLVFCNSVIEHVDDIDQFLSEVYRVLKPGGRFVAKTPNRNHYVAVIASVTPDWFHVYYNSLRGTQSRDIFPTTYVCNRLGVMRKTMARHGLQVVRLTAIEGRPEYLRITAPTYLLGLLYERTVNAFSVLEFLRCVILGVFEKTPCAALKDDDGTRSQE